MSSGSVKPTIPPSKLNEYRKLKPQNESKQTRFRGASVQLSLSNALIMSELVTHHLMCGWASKYSHRGTNLAYLYVFCDSNNNYCRWLSCWYALLCSKVLYHFWYVNFVYFYYSLTKSNQSDSWKILHAPIDSKMWYYCLYCDCLFK